MTNLILDNLNIIINENYINESSKSIIMYNNFEYILDNIDNKKLDLFKKLIKGSNNNKINFNITFNINNIIIDFNYSDILTEEIYNYSYEYIKRDYNNEELQLMEIIEIKNKNIIYEEKIIKLEETINVLSNEINKLKLLNKNYSIVNNQTIYNNVQMLDVNFYSQLFTKEFKLNNSSEYYYIIYADKYIYKNFYELLINEYEISIINNGADYKMNIRKNILDEFNYLFEYQLIKIFNNDNFNYIEYLNNSIKLMNNETKKLMFIPSHDINNPTKITEWGNSYCEYFINKFKESNLIIPNNYGIYSDNNNIKEQSKKFNNGNPNDSYINTILNYKYELENTRLLFLDNKLELEYLILKNNDYISKIEFTNNPPINLKVLYLCNFSILSNIEELIILNKLEHISFYKCNKLIDVSILNNLENLKSIDFSGIDNSKILKKQILNKEITIYL